MNYFELLDIPEQIVIDAKSLRMRYLIKARAFHPDHYMQDSELAQVEAIEMTSIINKAYETLKNSSTRIKYILELNGMIHDQNKNELTQDFLMEMMDINEKMMELEFDMDKNILSEISGEVEEYQNGLKTSINTIAEGFDKGEEKQVFLEDLKILYFKQKYLLRIQEKLDSFAAA